MVQFGANDIGAAQFDYASAFSPCCSTLYIGVFTPTKSLYTKYKLNRVQVTLREMFVATLIVKMIFLSTVRKCNAVAKFLRKHFTFVLPVFQSWFACFHNQGLKQLRLGVLFP